LPFREPALSLRDISDSIAMIQDFTAGMDFESFRGDPKTIAAVDVEIVWRTVVEDLPPLADSVRKALAKMN
jgi:uncharacterized protein with HEPN domain